MNINDNGGKVGGDQNKQTNEKKLNQKQEDLLILSLTCLPRFSPFQQRDAPCQKIKGTEINKQIRKFKIQNSSLCSQPDGAFASSSLVAGQAVRSDVPPSWCQHVPPPPPPPPPPLTTPSPLHLAPRCTCVSVACEPYRQMMDAPAP